jgi:hypothetical protein
MVDALRFAPSGGIVSPGDNVFTLHLPTNLTGKVVDSKGQPVAGAIVCALTAISSGAHPYDPELRAISRFTMPPFSDRYAVRTDSTGSYTLDNLPADSKVEIVLKDPRFVSCTVMSDRGAASAPTLTAVVGTFITGKVIRQDGKPIGSAIQVTAIKNMTYSNTPPTAKVDMDGTYKITGIAPGTYKVGLAFGEESADWAPPLAVDVTATLGAQGTAPDLVLTSGGLVTGSVLDADTKQPLAGVYVGFQDGQSYGTQGVSSKTGADGKFTARVCAGGLNVIVYNRSDDYVNDSSTQRAVTSVDDQTVTMDPILLKRALVVTALAVDDSGNPVPNINLTIRHVQEDRVSFNIPTATTSDKGAFSIHRLVPGDFWIDAGIDWAVVSPKDFTVPLASPLKLVLKKVATAAVQGMVVDTSNAPVVGADVAFDLVHNIVIGDGVGTRVDVTSGADGKFTLPDAPVDSTMVHRQSVTKDGYIYKSGGNISAPNGKVIVSPIVMAQLGGKVDGTVVNGFGKPVAAAWVFSPDSGNDAAPVKTDAAGHFELSNLVVGSVNVYAAKGLYFSQSTAQAVTTSAKTSVRLPDTPTAPVGPSNLTKATVMLTKNINDQTAKKDHEDEAWMRDQAAHIIAEVNLDDAVNFILSMSSISTWDLGSIVSAKTNSDPVGVASWAIVPIKRMSDNNGRGQTAVAIGLAVAPYDPVAAQPYYDIASQYIQFDHVDEQSITTAMSLTALAYILHRPEADDDYAKVTSGLDTLLKNSKNDPNTSSYSDWLPASLAKVIAFGNVDKAAAMLEAQPINTRYSYASQIVSELVKPNPAAAMAMYHWIGQDTASNNSQWARERAFCLVLPIIYKTDPKGAAVQAHAITDTNTEAQALTDLGDLMPAAAAAPLYQEAEDKATGQYNNGYSPACVAYHAWQRDRVLGAKLFKSAYTKFVALSAGPQQPGQGPSFSDFAFYYSHIDPALSRILIEEQFARDNRGSNQYYGGDSVQSDVAAMCAIDISRAVEMAGSIKDQNQGYNTYAAGLKPAQYVLLTPQQRSEIPFSQWSNSSDWVPGTPSN